MADSGFNTALDEILGSSNQTHGIQSHGMLSGPLRDRRGFKYYKLNNIKLVGGSSQNLCINGIDRDSCNPEKCIWNSWDNICYPIKYMDKKSTLSSSKKREAYKKSFRKNKIKLDKYIKLHDNLYLQFIQFIGSGNSGEIYEIKLYDSTMNEIKYDTDICVKVSGIINEEERQKDENEFFISGEMGEQNIGPKMYHHFIIEDFAIKSKIVSNIYNITSSSRFTSSDRFPYLSLIIMQKLDGYTYGDTYRFHYDQSPSRLTSAQKKQFCRKIDKMHSLGYIHNDLHQDNIFIDKREPYIIDFGYSKHINDFKPHPSRSLPGYYYKTLGNLFTNPGDIYTNNDQYCKKADWSCERGHQGELTYLSCKDALDGFGEKYSDKQQRVKINLIRNNQSGYI